MIGIEGADRAGRPGAAASMTVCASALLLVSCLGGGGGGGGGGGTSNLRTNPSTNYLSPAAEPSLPAVTADWSGSLEYANSTGLAQLKAAEGYARRGGGLPGGQGVRIAIVDSGIDVTHPDLGNLAKTSWTAGGEPIVGDSHATFVAGIAGASRTQLADPNDMHGMAYRATLVNFQAFRPSQGGNSFATGDLVDALRAASGLTAGSSAVESDIFNLSLGALSNNDNTFAALRTAMRSAASEGKIMVLAAGNEGLSGNPADRLQPIYPAAYADDTGIAGFAIVVGNLTAANQVAPSSNHCGDTKNYCLFAPGTNTRSTLNGGSYGIGSGTSFSAPYVSGAAAVVKAAFPGISSRDVVDRLLLTAVDLGAAGVDSVFGQGRLDLEAAMAPVGPTGFPFGPTVDGPIVPIEATHLRLGPGLAVNGAAKKLLARAMAVDSMGFPFPVDLGSAVETTNRDSGLSTFIGDHRQSLVVTGPSHARLVAFVPENDAHNVEKTSPASSLTTMIEDDRAPPLKFAADLTEGATVFASLHGGDEARLGLGARLAELRATSMQSSGFLTPHRVETGAPFGAGFSVSPVDGMEIALSAFGSLGEGDVPKTSLQRLELMQVMPGEIEARVALGLMQEDEGFLGGSAGGAFGDGVSARSQFLTVSVLGPLADDIDWFATYSHGRSSIDEADHALIDDWSDPHAEAFGAGLVVRDVVKPDDGFTLMVGQPLRRKRAEARIHVPIARAPDGAVVTAREQLDLTPKAREIVTEIGYRLSLDENGDHDLRAAGFLRLHPDHDRDRGPEGGIGLAYRVRF